MQPPSNEVELLTLAIISGLVALLPVWRCYHFITLEPECPLLERTRDQVSQVLPRRNWYGAVPFFFAPRELRWHSS